MSKLDKNLDAASGILNMILALAVIFTIIFARSEQVSALFVGGGIIVFGTMFMYGLQKFITARE